MAATTLPIPGLECNGGFGGGVPFNGFMTSETNTISEIIDYFTIHLRCQVRSPPPEFSGVCISLARLIDFSMAHHEVPERSLELASLLKKVCLWNKDTQMKAAVMVLMISVKNVCKSGWFSERDSTELNTLAKEIASDFHFSLNFDPKACSNSVINSIMSRYFPKLKIGNMLVFLEVKPGFDAYVSDFQVSWNLKTTPEDKIRLFVAQIDCIETSSCLITPSNVTFLVNGHPVRTRTNLFMDSGPQIPTDLMLLLICGTNLLQAVGEFKGNYIIAIALMSEMLNADSSTIQDYEKLDSPIVDSDADIIEEASRISLNCPISFTRIKTPVKGHLCRHFQCFDFDNYVEMNSRRPSWRCPHCNQYTCFADIRIDRTMVMILKVVGSDVTNVIFSSDGSWNAVIETDGTTQKPEDMAFNSERDESPLIEFVSFTKDPDNILDLTQREDTIGIASHQTKEIKLFANGCPTQPRTQNMAVNSHVTNTNYVHQSISGSEINSRFGLDLSTFIQASSSISPNSQNSDASFLSSNHFATLPVLNCTVSTSPNRDVYPRNCSALSGTSVPRGGTYLSNPLPMQQHQFGFPFIRNQGPPVRTSSFVLQPRSKNDMNTYIQNGLSAAYQVSSSVRSNSHSMYLYPLNPNSVIQASVRPTQQNVTRFQSSSQQMMNHLKMPCLLSQYHGSTRSSVQLPATHLVRPQTHSRVSLDRTPEPWMDTNNHSLAYVGNPGVNISVGVQPAIRLDSNDPPNLNLRRAGRMRGALSGPAFDNAYNEYIVQPQQQAQATQPLPNITSILANIASPLQSTTAGRILHNPTGIYHPYT